jgi:MFS family permease
MELFQHRSTSICYFATFLHGMILWAVLYYIPLYFEAVKCYSPIITGVAILPQTLTVVPCAIAVGITAARTGRYRWALWVGWALTLAGIGLLCLLNIDSTTVQCIFLMLSSGIGMGLLFPAMALAIQASAPQKDIAIAAAMFSFFRAFGQTVGVAVGGVVFQNRITAELAKFPDLVSQAKSYSLDAVALEHAISQLPTDMPQTLHLKIGFASAIKFIWILMCGLAGISLAMSFFVQGYDLNRDINTEQGLRHTSAEKVPFDQVIVESVNPESTIPS